MLFLLLVLAAGWGDACRLVCSMVDWETSPGCQNTTTGGQVPGVVYLDDFWGTGIYYLSLSHCVDCLPFAADYSSDLEPLGTSYYSETWLPSDQFFGQINPPMIDMTYAGIGECRWRFNTSGSITFRIIASDLAPSESGEFDDLLEIADGEPGSTVIGELRPAGGYFTVTSAAGNPSVIFKTKRGSAIDCCYSGFTLTWQVNEACGSGIKAPDEECDDGNTANHDGCSALCAVEYGHTCQTPGQPCTVDVDPPTAVISVLTNPTAVSPFVVTITFDEDVRPLQTSDVVVSNGLMQGAFLVLSRSAYSFVVLAYAEGYVNVNLKAGVTTDLGGSNVNLPASLAVLYSVDCANSAFGPHGRSCRSGGTCLDVVLRDAHFECNCSETPFTGSNCQNPPGDCSNSSAGPGGSQCEHFGQCVDETPADGAHHCACEHTGFYGDNCENDCATLTHCVLCASSSNCTECAPGFQLHPTNRTCYQARDCDVPSNGPGGHACVHGGECRDTRPLDRSFECDCPPPYAGRNCEAEATVSGVSLGDSISASPLFADTFDICSAVQLLEGGVMTVELTGVFREEHYDITIGGARCHGLVNVSTFVRRCSLSNTHVVSWVRSAAVAHDDASDLRSQQHLALKVTVVGTHGDIAGHMRSFRLQIPRLSEGVISSETIGASPPAFARFVLSDMDGSSGATPVWSVDTSCLRVAIDGVWAIRYGNGFASYRWPRASTAYPGEVSFAFNPSLVGEDAPTAIIPAGAVLGRTPTVMISACPAMPSSVTADDLPPWIQTMEDLEMCLPYALRGEACDVSLQTCSTKQLLMVDGLLYRGVRPGRFPGSIADDETALRSNVRAFTCCMRCNLGAACPAQYVEMDGCCIALHALISSRGPAGGPSACPHGQRIVGNFSDVGNIAWVCVQCGDGEYSPPDNQLSRCLPCPPSFSCAGGELRVSDPNTFCTNPAVPSLERSDFVHVERGRAPQKDQQGNLVDYNFMNPLLFPSPRQSPCPILGSCQDAGHVCLDEGHSCSRGYTGDVCGTCQTGYFKFEGLCAECPVNAMFIALVMGACFLLFIGLFLMFAVRTGKSPSSLFVLMQVSITHLQVLNMTLSFQVPWPPALLLLLSFFSPLVFDIDLVYMGPSCISGLESSNHPLVTLVFYTLILPTIPLLVFLVLGIGARVCGHRIFITYGDVGIRFILLFYNFAYIFTSQAAMEVFNCVEVGTQWRLVSNPSVVCSLDTYDADGSLNRLSSEWARMVLISALSLLFWGIVYPLFLTTKLYMRKHRLDEDRVLERWGIFYNNYHRRSYNWELLVMFRKFVLAFASTVLTRWPVTQITLCLLVLLACWLLLVIRRPFVDNRLNRLVVGLELSECVALASGLVFLRAKMSDDALVAVDAIVVIIVLASLLCIIVVTVMDLYQKCESVVHHTKRVVFTVVAPEGVGFRSRPVFDAKAPLVAAQGDVGDGFLVQEGEDGLKYVKCRIKNRWRYLPMTSNEDDVGARATLVSTEDVPLDLTAEWTIRRSEDDQLFYLNLDTGEKTWTHPDPPAESKHHLPLAIMPHMSSLHLHKEVVVDSAYSSSYYSDDNEIANGTTVV